MKVITLSSGGGRDQMGTEVKAGRAGRIFISYRREDAAYPAGWLYDRLSDTFGGGQVFKDVDSLQPGDDFVEKITSAVSKCDVLLAVIGPDWVGAADEHGKPRLEDPADFVRVEIEAALTRRIRVIPLLVEGAKMPRATDVPPSLSPLVRRHALELSPTRFNRDADDLVGVLRKELPPTTEIRPATATTSSRGGQAPASTSTAAAPVSSASATTERQPPTGRASTPMPSAVAAASPPLTRAAPAGARTAGRPAVPSAPSSDDPKPTTVLAPPPTAPTVPAAHGSSERRSRRVAVVRQRLRRVRSRWWVAAAAALVVILTGAGLLLFSGGLPRSQQPLPDDVLIWRPKPPGEDFHLATLDIHGQGDRPLTSAGARDSSAVLSHDRRTVLFLRSDSQHKRHYTLYASGASGGREKKLFSDGTAACPELNRPAWSSQGLLAVVCSQAEGRHDKLNLMTLKGDVVRTLDEGELGDPAFTSDGNSVVYWRNRAGGTEDGGAIVQVATDGGSEPVLLTPGKPGQDADPACSPTGNEIAFRHTAGKVKSIDVVRAGGGLQDYSHQLTPDGTRAQDPTWSPDGSQIAFRMGPNDHLQLWVMNSDGKSARPVLTSTDSVGASAWTAR